MSKKVDELLWAMQIQKNDVNHLIKKNDQYEKIIDSLTETIEHQADDKKKMSELEEELLKAKEDLLKAKEELKKKLEIKNPKIDIEKDFVKFVKDFDFKSTDAEKLKKIISKIK